MKAARDPEGAEIAHLAGVCELTGKNVLEIGCGDGKFVRQYASLPKRLVGIDPEFIDLCTARNHANAIMSNSYFVQTVGEKLPFASGSFDLIVFASSL
jgi:ubiquinone/menaquinone biosynthesis C-methylase UbiE